MTPAARAAAAIAVLDAILDGAPAEQSLLRWARGSRYAGSGDRAAVRDLVFDSLRRRRSRAALGGAETGRGLIIGMCRETGQDPAALFTGDRHAAPPLVPGEGDGHAPEGFAALDLPDWIATRMQADLGADFAAIANMLRDRAPVWLRVNQTRGTPQQAAAALQADGIVTQPAPCLPTALRVTEGERRVARSTACQNGLVELQDLSPQRACAALSVQPGERVLDFCAGGGGKALALAAQGATVTAHDADPARMRDLPVRAARAGTPVAIADLRSLRGVFDTVVADVPCSGSGTWRRTPGAKWRLSAPDLDRLVALQAEILQQAATLVRSGGRLVYMTCSLLTCENDGQLRAFLAGHPDFRLLRAETLTPLTASDGFFHAELARIN